MSHVWTNFIAGQLRRTAGRTPVSVTHGTWLKSLMCGPKIGGAHMSVICMSRTVRHWISIPAGRCCHKWISSWPGTPSSSPLVPSFLHIFFIYIQERTKHRCSTGNKPDNELTYHTIGKQTERVELGTANNHKEEHSRLETDFAFYTSYVEFNCACRVQQWG